MPNLFAAAKRTTIAGVALLALILLCMMPTTAFAVTSAEKQAEADSIMQEIDVLQTNLNEANQQLEEATAQRDDAVAKRDEAEKNVEKKTEEIKDLQERLSECATNMYKTGGSASFIEVILGASTFEDFLTSWDAISAITGQGANLVEQSKEAREAEQKARDIYEQESKRADEQVASADEAKQRIEATKASLEEELKKVTEEVALLQAQEELQAEAARQAAAAAEAMAANYAGVFAGSATPTSGIGATGGSLNHPLPGYPYSSGFGWRDFNGGSFHQGLDIAAAEGTPYYAAESGIVVYATYDGGYNGGAGNWIVISHGNGMVTKYMHSSRVYVRVGQQVERGQNIGAVGNTGQSFGAHLHFQLEFNGVAVDPAGFI